MKVFRNSVEDHILNAIGEEERDVWKASISYLNGLDWQLSWNNKDGEWHLYSNSQLIFNSRGWLAIQSFVYGLVHSSLQKEYRIKYSSKLPNRTQIKNKEIEVLDDRPLNEVFEEFVSISEHLYMYELRFATPGRAVFMYRTYQNGQTNSDHLQELKQFSILYERKLELDEVLAVLTKEGVNHLIVFARGLKPISLSQSERLPVAINFLYSYLEWKQLSWYRVKRKWLYYSGDQLLFSANTRNDFEAFILGQVYNFAILPNETLDKLKKPLLKR